MFEQISELWANHLVRAVVVVLGSVLLAWAIRTLGLRAVLFFVRRTKTDVDDRIVAILQRPVFVTVIVAGLAEAVAMLTRGDDPPWAISATTRFAIFGALQSIVIVVWVIASIRVGKTLLIAMGHRNRRGSLVKSQTVPLFDIGVKVAVLAVGIYLLLAAWHVDPSGWLASAGVLGIVVGLAAKDSLANLFAGLFIIADAPYKLYDVILLDSGLRGRVTDIGIRSTRLLTRDDIEIIVPNSLIGNSKIINETAGPTKTRQHVSVSCAYGADTDKMREVLLGAAEGAEHVCTEPKPTVRFRSFGESGLNFELLFWIDDPMQRGLLIDQLNDRVYKAMNRAGIEIPYNKLDVYVKQNAAPS